MAATGINSRTMAGVAVRKFARILSLLRSELPNQSDTSNLMIPVSLLNPKFAKVPAEQLCELRVRDTWLILPMILFSEVATSGRCVRIAGAWIPSRCRVELPAGRPMSANVHKAAVRMLLFGCCPDPAKCWTCTGSGTGSSHMRNIPDVAPDQRPGTLRLRRNYGLRSPGNPLPPHRRRTALPIRAPGSGAGLDLQRRPPVRQGRVTTISSKEQ
jgi:hypothetical protein